MVGHDEGDRLDEHEEQGRAQITWAGMGWLAGLVRQLGREGFRPKGGREK
jgi:hypothetical protein